MFQLKKGDQIGVFSPSLPGTYTSPNRFKRSKQFMESKGFRIVDGSLTGKHDGYRSGSIKDRAQELNELIRNPEIKCIMSSVGGSNSNSLLPYLDYEAIKKHPKMFVGYSDVTAILLGIYAKTGIQTFYGPTLISSLGEFPPYVNNTFSSFEDMLIKSEALPYEYPLYPVWTDEQLNWQTQNRSKKSYLNEWVCVKEGVTTGRLIAGNLATMLSIWGSPYMPAINRGDILMIEDCKKTAALVEKHFSFLKINGTFDKVSGVILGKHEQFDDQGTGLTPYDILLEVIGDLDIPILANFDCCHTHSIVTMPIGATVELNATQKTVRILSF
ncbi:S66 peptidase family protein [Bacillus sp. CGMCC 1.60114]|uniref:S66 family peptidase n=1 Tax=unclassified Bacillus (in: firmicutes) TaxID=185979 RepID=UPI003638274E